MKTLWLKENHFAVMIHWISSGSFQFSFNLVNAAFHVRPQMRDIHPLHLWSIVPEIIALQEYIAFCEHNKYRLCNELTWQENAFASQITFQTFWGYSQSRWKLLLSLQCLICLAQAPKSLGICRYHQRVPVFPSVSCVTSLSPNRRNPIIFIQLIPHKKQSFLCLAPSLWRCLYHAEGCFKKSPSWQALRPILGLSNLTAWPILPCLQIFSYPPYPSLSVTFLAPTSLIAPRTPPGLTTKERLSGKVCHRACPLLMYCNVSIIIN